MEKSCRSPARIPLRFCASNRARTRGGQCARAASRKINGDASTPTYNRIASARKRKSSDLRKEWVRIVPKLGQPNNSRRNRGVRVLRPIIFESRSIPQTEWNREAHCENDPTTRLQSSLHDYRSDNSHVNAILLRGKFKSIEKNLIGIFSFFLFFKKEILLHLYVIKGESID